MLAFSQCSFLSPAVTATKQPVSFFLLYTYFISFLFLLSQYNLHSFLLSCCCDCANFPNVGSMKAFSPSCVCATSMHYVPTDSDLRQAVCGQSVIFCTVSRRQRLFENLRMLPHAPGVQMQAIPEDAVQEDSGDEEEDDPNKRISSKKPPAKSRPLLRWHLGRPVFKANLFWLDLQSAPTTRG